MSARRNITGSSPSEVGSPLAACMPEGDGGTSLQQEVARLRTALTDCDTIASDTSAQLVALAVAAQQMLAMDANALTRVYALLETIQAVAELMGESIDGATSDLGRVSKPIRKSDEFHTRIWEESHALRRSVREGGAT